VAVLLGEYDLDSDPDCPGCRPVQRFLVQPRDVTVHPRSRIADELAQVSFLKLRSHEQAKNGSVQFFLYPSDFVFANALKKIGLKDGKIPISPTDFFRVLAKKSNGCKKRIHFLPVSVNEPLGPFTQTVVFTVLRAARHCATAISLIGLLLI
jgi:hypothetical protein